MSEPILSLQEQSRNLPDSPGVYLFKSPSGVILYVGKAKSLRKRTASYFRSQGQEQPKIRFLTQRATQLDFILTESERQALLLESNLIKRHRPRYNVLLRDDKSYPYLKLTVQEPFPRILISRRPIKDGARYYGPYPNLKVREIVKLMHRVFHLRDCGWVIPEEGPPLLKRPCLSHQIKQCPGPCVRLVDRAGYAALVEKAKFFLEGHHELLLDWLESEMQKAADRLEYEEAAALRDIQSSIRNMQAASTILTPEHRDADAVALATGYTRVWASLLQVRDGKLVESLTLTLDNEMEASLPEVLPAFLEQFYGQGVYLPPEVIVSKEMDLVEEMEGWVQGRSETTVSLHGPQEPWQEELIALAERNVLQSLKEEVQQGETLEELKRLLGLKRPPRVMACFDISNLQGTFTVGSAVVFREGAPDKSLYRKFRIKGVEGIDDYASHREMMGRYLDLVERDGLPIPDLFLIDGGKGQLSTVEPVLREHFKNESFGLASLAKREEEIFIPGCEAPVDFRGKIKARYLLQRIRDEAHRFAVGYHRILRDKNALMSLLEAIPGIGPQRLRSLYRAFDSPQKVKEATQEELASIPGFNKVLAENIYRHFNPQK
jgi:excinuclease ABC subunit C